MFKFDFLSSTSLNAASSASFTLIGVEYPPAWCYPILLEPLLNTTPCIKNPKGAKFSIQFNAKRLLFRKHPRCDPEISKPPDPTQISSHKSITRLHIAKCQSRSLTELTSVNRSTQVIFQTKFNIFLYFPMHNFI